MGLIRLVIFALVIWLVWRLITNYQAGKKTAKAGSRLEKKTMVKCRYCAVHLPQQEALAFEDQWFCDEQHKQKYLADKND